MTTTSHVPLLRLPCRRRTRRFSAPCYVRDNPRAHDKSFQVSSMQGVQAPDDRRVVFTLKAPNAYLFSQIQLSNSASQAIIPEELLDTLDTAWPVGSGPYQLVEYQLNVRYLYRRFDGFRESARGLPYTDEREVSILTDAATQEAAFRSEQLHVWRANPGYSATEPLRRDLGARIAVDGWPALGFWALSLNATRPPWNDVRAREAVYRLADRQQYLDLLDQGKSQVATGPLSVGMTDYQLDARQTEKYFRQDGRAARQLLEAAGFPFDEEVEMVLAQGAKNQQAGEIFQQQMSRVGVKVRLLSVPLAEWVGTYIGTGNWDAWTTATLGYDVPQIPLRLQHSNTLTRHVANGPKDPAIDALIERAEVTLDRGERIRLVKEIQLALLDRYTPYMALYSATIYEPRWAYLRDWEINQATFPLYRVEAWLDR